jgi:hypothetical protein
MYAEEYITEAQYETAINTPVNSSFVNISPPRAGCLAGDVYARFFCDYVIKNVENFESLGATPQKSATNVGARVDSTCTPRSTCPSRPPRKTASGNSCPTTRSALSWAAPPPVSRSPPDESSPWPKTRSSTTPKREAVSDHGSQLQYRPPLWWLQWFPGRIDIQNICSHCMAAARLRSQRSC